MHLQFQTNIAFSARLTSLGAIGQPAIRMRKPR